MNNLLSTRLHSLMQSAEPRMFDEICRGIEREALRISPSGVLSDKAHPKALGQALTHDYITTDYAESLLEFITPTATNAEKTLAQLRDIHRFTLKNMGDEILWPSSMPCYVGDDEDIELANYGSSNVGQMKRLYRKGLKHRYGSIMQIISGVHFNMSFPNSFWQHFYTQQDDIKDYQDFVSDGYFALIRNYKRLCWVIPYLYGASPALCSSFVEKTKSNLPFETAENGAMYLPYATSLRMSDLGYTNSSQSELKITYNSLDEYCQGLCRAITTKSEEYAQIGVHADGEFKQLNDNILQIENEFYSAIRPKRVTQGMEKPTQALYRRGVEYIEVRALDVNPFVSTGIDLQQVHFLDVFLTYCALQHSPTLSVEQQQETENNVNDVVLRGRDPALSLFIDGKAKPVHEWLTELFDELEQVAEAMSELSRIDYQAVVAVEREKVDDASKTFSGRYLDKLLQPQGVDAGSALDVAKSYADDFVDSEYEVFSQQEFDQAVENSFAKQTQIEQSDNLSFEQFLRDYFADKSGSDCCDRQTG